ncbi:MAG: hypothetical protein JNN08_13685 [Bryobacterales bacterium]|nr:hypothetical protein [Bryobacterales bacterium]
MLPAGFINVADIGIAPANSAADNTKAALKAQRDLGERVSQRWLFDGVEYHFDDTFHVIRPIWLEGVGGSRTYPRTELVFPPGKHGLYFHYAQTYSNQENSDAQGGAAINLKITGGGRSAVSRCHGVVLRCAAFLAHLYIGNFRGNGIHAVGQLKDTLSCSPSLFRVESIHAANNGDSIGVIKMSRTGRVLKVQTAVDHYLSEGTKDPPYAREGDLIWLESTDPDFPRGVCQVTSALSSDEFTCEHSDETLKGTNAEAFPDKHSYHVVTGHGIYTQGEDANVGTVFGCSFTQNSGFGVIEDSSGGNTYYACHADHNDLGPYRALNSSADGTVFVGCYSEMGQKPSEIGSPAVVVGGLHGAGIVGNAIGFMGQYIDNAKARVLIGPGDEMTTMGSLALGSSQHRPPFAAPTHLQLLHSEKANGVQYEDYSLAYSYDDAAFAAEIKSSLSAYDWQRVYVLGQSTQGAAFLLTTRESVSRGGRPVRFPSIAFPSGWYTRDGKRFTAAKEMPDAKNVSSEEMTWECGDRVFRVFDKEEEATGPEGWVCVKSGTFGTYREPFKVTVVAADPFTAESDTPREAGGLMSWAASKAAGPWV